MKRRGRQATPVSTAKRVGRLGVLAVGLGIGAAVVSTGTAAADDFQISIDGMDLFPTAGNTATATSGMGDIAIAIGANSDAIAEGGIGDIATANGANSFAEAGGNGVEATGNNYDVATATGNLSSAEVSGGSFDAASANGVDNFAFSGGEDSNFEVANVSGTDSMASAYSSHDSASVFGNDDNALSGLNGSFDSASIVGNNSTADATFGEGDHAFVVDLLNARDLVGSQAFAGGTETTPGNFDLAGVFGDGLMANSIGDFIAHIAPFF